MSAELQDWQRPPFEPGHTLSTKHGAYATVQLGSRVAELADLVREVVPGFAPSDEMAVRLLCLALARLERAEEALATMAPGDAGRLRQDALGWGNSARRLLNDLGMTPLARARLGVDLARMHVDGLALLEERGRQVREARGEAA